MRKGEDIETNKKYTLALVLACRILTDPQADTDPEYIHIMDSQMHFSACHMHLHKKNIPFLNILHGLSV